METCCLLLHLTAELTAEPNLEDMTLAEGEDVVPRRRAKRAEGSAGRRPGLLGRRGLVSSARASAPEKEA